MAQMNPLLALLAGQQQRRPGIDPYANEEADLFGLEGQFGDEATTNAILAERAGAPPNVTNSFNKSANRYKGQQALTMAAMEPTPQQQMTSEAVSQGFGLGPQSPVQDVDPVRARNIYRRQQEQEKMRQPIQQEELRNRGALDRQKLVNKGAMDLSAQNNEAMADRNAQYQELMDLIQSEGGQPIQRMTMPGRYGGGGFATQTPKAPPSQSGQLNQLAVIRGNLAKQGVENPFQNFATPKTQDEANFVQAVNGMIGQAPLDGSVKQGILSFLRNPQDATAPLNELFDMDQMTPQERTAIVNLFTQIRGY